MRQVVLDTETTGLDPQEGHRIIEIGCVEMIDRSLTGNNFHQYVQPDREIDAAAIEVHGITNDFLRDKPRFDAIAPDFIAYVEGAELIIHNAPFDAGFLDYELKRCEGHAPRIATLCQVTDTLVMAKQIHPGQRNSLDALCKRYDIDNSHRALHGALLDAEILADVYLTMTGGQASLSLVRAADGTNEVGVEAVRRLPVERTPLLVVRPNAEELAAHAARLQAIAQASDDGCVWLDLG